MRRHVKTVHIDFKDDETIDDRENPEIIAEDNAGDKADNDEPNIKDKAETDDIDIDVEEEEEEEAEAEAEEEEDKEEFRYSEANIDTGGLRAVSVGV